MWKWAAAGFLLLLINDGILLFIQRRRRQEELKMISDLLTEILDEKPELSVQELEDTFVSKIVHQLMKLKEKTEGKYQKISRDRDEIRRLIAEIAHQIRNPLTNMETYLDFLSEVCEEETQKRYLRAVIQSEEKIHFLAESFVKMARLENRVIQIRKSREDLLSTLAEAAELAEGQARKKRVPLKILPYEKEELLVPHDPNWLGEAVYNLLDNAVKYSATGSPVEMGIQKSEMSVRIQVRDYGIGICKGEETEIFQRFARGKNVTDQAGFGLGLYLTREIVNQHDGFVRVKRMEEGTLFEISLPTGDT